MRPWYKYARYNKMYMSTQMAQTSVKANSVRVLNSDADFASE